MHKAGTSFAGALGETAKGRGVQSNASGRFEALAREDFDDGWDLAEDEAPGRGAPKEDWFSTHPFSPMRVHALKLFHESSLMKEGGTSREELEVGVQREAEARRRHGKVGEDELAARRALRREVVTDGERERDGRGRAERRGAWPLGPRPPTSQARGIYERGR